MIELLQNPDTWVAFATLAALEIVLGIDNLIFIAILADKLPKEQQARARRLGILAALGSRLVLLFALTWIMKLTATLFTVGDNEISGKDLVLIIGGLFLLYKATREIHEKLEGDQHQADSKLKSSATFAAVIGQIMIIDVVFSLDSIITAVGMVDQLSIMVAAVIAAVGFMLVFAGSVHGFVSRHPTVKILALSFLLMIGLALVADGVNFHIPKGYIYGAMAFSVMVEVLNIRLRKPGPPVHLHEPMLGPAEQCPHCRQPMPPDLEALTARVRETRFPAAANDAATSEPGG